MHDITPDTRIVVRCSNCDAKIRAARSLAGRTCPCPRCKQPIAVRVPLPSDADVALVFDSLKN